MNLMPETNKIEVHCAKCGNSNVHSIENCVAEKGTDEYSGGDWSDSYQTIRCDGCQQLSFRRLFWFSEAMGGDQFHYDDGTTESLYPKRTEHTRSTLAFTNVPENIRRIYRETLDCYNESIFTMCGAGLRSTIEAVCKDQGVTGGDVTDENGVTKRRKNLQGKINGLAENGVLTIDNAHALHEHRFLGNDAVHELALPARKELELAIELMEHVITSIYEITRSAEHLAKLRSQRRG